ncbi:DMT family transporter [Alkalilacustris brevis]|uniref:DMT family transporter n=1 Tax=Alkalilacustris brevis TaxID=2026338 RepID=UPI000E0D16C6|nr:DMT family transporter [Alkalilacustris brevis]
MRLFLVSSLVMVFFAANSLLNRLALAEEAIGAAEFAAIRLASGALMLAGIIAVRDRHLRALRRADPWGVAGLTLYMLGFSFAYLWLDAGLGALILFGGVQITMFAGALLRGETLAPRRIGGAAMALAGLAWLTSPAGAAPYPVGAALMAAAALGWGIYSLRGARAGDALAATATNFLWATPFAVLAMLAFAGTVATSLPGIGLAILSGAVTSGLGYALWYAVLPHLAASAAAVAQLTVPVIALAGGALLLGEPPSLPAMLAAAVVLGGVGLALTSRLR